MYSIFLLELERSSTIPFMGVHCKHSGSREYIIWKNFFYIISRYSQISYESMSSYVVSSGIYLANRYEYKWET